jgi:hypothetical protein
MTPLAIAHKALKGDLSNTLGGLCKGENYLYLDNRDQSYVTLKVDSWMARASLTCISTVEEFNNFKGDDVKTVYTQEMADNGVFPSVGMECNFAIVGGLWQDVHVDYISDVLIVVTDSKGDQASFLIEDSRFNPESTPPVELIDGKAYQFDYYTGSVGMNNVVMRYRKSGDYFYFDNTIFERKFCTNIKPLTVEEK